MFVECGIFDHKSTWCMNSSLGKRSSIQAARPMDSFNKQIFIYFFSTSCYLSPKDAVVCRHFFICVLFVAIVHLSPINANYRHSSSNPVVCQSKECLRSAADFKQNMNFSANPCDDFYSYVCGHWADNHPKTHSWPAVQRIKIERMIRDQLETNISRSDPKPVAQAKHMYRACLRSLKAREKLEFKKVQNRNRFRGIKKYLEKFGLPTIPTLLKHGKKPIPNFEFDWISSVAKIQRKLGLNIMIGLNFAYDYRNFDRFRLTLGYFGRTKLFNYPWYGWSALMPKGHASKTINEKPKKSDGDTITNDEQQNFKSYPEHLEKTFNSLNAAINSSIHIQNKNSKFFTLAEKYRAFQKQLPVLDDEWDSELPEYYTVAELQNITDSHIAPRKPYPVWQHYLDTLFADLPDKKLAADEKLLISPKHVKYLCNLIDFISEQSPEHIELYIWKTVIEFLVGHRYNYLRSKETCQDYVQQLMDVAVTYAITDKNFLNETKPRVEQMFNDIRSEFNQMVLETEWLDAQTKNAMVERSNGMEARIGVPEWVLNVDKLEEQYRGLKVDGFHHFENWVNALHIFLRKRKQLFHVNSDNFVHIDPKIANAYNGKYFNAIYITGARLQYPFYNFGLEALNYGVVGFALGHEITHYFDGSNRLYDKYSRYKQMWSTHSLRKFDERARCLIKQYDSYYVPEAESYIKGIRTLLENIADNGGIREAFRAYRAYAKLNEPEPLLPGFEDYTHEQLFFISYANQFCETLSSSDKKRLLKDTHSPGKFRVLGVLSNMEEFSEAFQCPRGSKMNPEKKCRVW